MAAGCALCRGLSVETLIDFGSHPIAHGFLDAPDEDEYTHPVTLGFCPDCGLTQLLDPIPPERLNTEFMVSAWKHNPHLRGVLDQLEALPGISKDSFVLEAGSNDAMFLSELQRRGFSRLHGLDPAAHAVEAANARGMEIRHAFFTPDTAREIVDSFGQCDLFVARQVLEHVGDLPAFAEAMRIALAPDAWVLIEVPDFGFNQDAFDYSAIWEEHVNHFTEHTMARFLAEAGVGVERVQTAVFSGQALIVFGRAGRAATLPDTPIEHLRAGAYAYRDRWPAFRAAINEYLQRERERGRRIGVYGAGCRTSALINYCGLGSHLECVLDDQAEKQGKFMPGSRLEVRTGDVLNNGDLDVVLLAVNAENESKVIERRRGFVERGGEFVSVHPPSDRLPDFWPSA